ncbi:hypothetical protein BCR32DRAFT_270938, partial [Anaeromyces robustus]
MNIPKSFVTSININAIGFEVSESGLISTITYDFNEYSKLNNLDITLELTSLTSENSTIYINGEEVSIQSLLANKSKKYDIYFYNNSYASEISEHLMDLNEYISPEITEKYYSYIFNNTYILNNRLIGFPIDRGISIFYSNKESLDEDDKSLQKTWKDILDLMFDGDDSNEMRSIYENLLSYYADLESQETIEGLEVYQQILIVTLSEGINIGINNYIDKEKKLEAIKVLEFLLSKEEQKKLIMNQKVFSGMNELYYDDEVCSVISCDVFRNIQLFPQYNQEGKENIDEYPTNFENNIFEFLNGNKTTVDVLDKVNDLTLLHQMTLDTN